MSGQFEFDSETGVEPAEGRVDAYAGSFGDGWRIGNGVNGGVIMCLATNALQQRLDLEGAHGDPLAFSGYFLTPSGPGPVEATTEVLRVGRTMSTGQVSVSQPGPDGVLVERMRALASFGDLDASAQVMQTAPPPDMPPPEECVSSTDAPEFLTAATLLERIEIRLDPATAGWAAGRPSGRGEMRGWLRLRDGREPDPTMLLFALDALPPVAFNLGILGWAPTLEFTGHVRGRPAPGWLRVSLSSQNITAGLMEEDAMVWDSEGRFVAQSRQLCGIRTPR
ncbi:MAG TPA: thioesterase family protein [Lapillicoccus sp.]|nr:thioesterase family protein [Lapillicoccus sp.]